MNFGDEYRRLIEKLIEKIKEGTFFRPDNFRNKPWYSDFQVYMTGDVCQPSEEHTLRVRKALKVMGYDTHIVGRDGRAYILPGEAR